MRLKKIKIFLTVLPFLFQGCASLNYSPPVEEMVSEGGYSFNNLLAEGNEIGDNLMAISFSGGGTRAGALAYGVAKKLESVKLPDGGTLLDETKVISSVSGGSFASAYYGLYGKEKFLEDYRKDILDENISKRVLLSLFRLVRWIPAALSKDFGRSEIAQEIYDKRYFQRKTFADMPRKWPFIVINSTDMTRGSTLSFIQEDFDMLCTDLNDVKVSRAVVASSAFPGPFTPLTFKNYAKSSCGYRMPDWAKQVLAEHPEKDLEKYYWAKNVESYMDHEKRPYIHLFDGGVADNLGLRPLLYAFRAGRWNLLDEEKRINAKRLILVVVDARPAFSTEADQDSAIPKFMQIMMNAATLPMQNYTIKTVEEFMRNFEDNRVAGRNYEKFVDLCNRAYGNEKDRKKCYATSEQPRDGIHKPPYPETYLIYVQFDAVKDPKFRQYLSEIPTDLKLSEKQIDALINAADDIMENSPDFQRLVHDLGGAVERNDEYIWKDAS